MPLHTAPLNRRSFLAQGASAVAGMAVLQNAWGTDAAVSPHAFALLSDTHIPDSPDVAARGVNMTANLQQVIREVIASPTKPASVIINGDCAYLKGQPADYRNLATCVAPLAEAGLPLHVTMGNHDDRQPLYNALQGQQPQQPLLDSRHVSILETPHANWFLLDSLTQVNVVTGELGATQREWLAKALAARTDKPALVMTHHTPQFEPPAEENVWTGLKDTAELLSLLESFAHVKAFLFGHSHRWSVTRHNQLHLINLPPVAYVFAEGQPNGWVQATVRQNGLTLRLKTIDPAHAKNGELVELTWT